MGTMEPIFADNCGACGEEYLSTQLIPVKLGNTVLSRVRICLGCLVQSDIYQNYKEAAEAIVQSLSKHEE